MSIATKSSGSEAENSCDDSFWRFWIPFRAQLAHCTKVVYASFAIFGQQYLCRILSYISQWPEVTSD